MTTTATPLRRGQIAPTAVVGFAPHRLLPLASDTVAVLAENGTGWVVMPEPAYRATVQFLAGEHRFGAADQESARMLVRLWESGLLLADGRAHPASHVDPPKWPDALLVKLTGGCNIACSYCYDYDATRFSARLDPDRIIMTLNALSERVSTLSVVFHGGEPFLRLDVIREVVAHAEALAGRGLKVAFSVQTNGTLLSDEAIDLIEEHDISVGISLDGLTEQANSLRVVRRGPTVLSQVRKLMDERPDFVRKRCGFLAVASRTSAPHLPELALWLQDFGVTGLSVSFLDPVGRAACLPNECLTPQEAVGLVGQFVTMVRDGRLGPLELTTLTARTNNLFTLTARDLCNKGPCGAAGEFLVLDAEGEFRTCDCIYHPFFQLGRDTLPDSSHPARMAVVERVDRLRAAGNGCRECALTGLCGGTCVAKALARTGNPDSVDETECAITRYLYPELLEEFAGGGATPLLDYYKRHRGGSQLAATGD